jgi:2-succinyl-6-hydroxy-2,4-cyclohexadiene-1-carboxylate synthase
VRGLVCIHGFTGSPASFDPLARALALRGRVRLCRPTLLGHRTASATSSADAGRRRRSPARFEDEVERVATLVVSEGFAGAHLLGYSLGARVALGLLAHYPFLFAGATLIGVHPGLGSLEERAARVGSDERWCALLERRGVAAFLEAWEAQPLFSSQRGLDPRLTAEQRRVRGEHSAEGLARALRVLGLGGMPNYRGALVSCPVRVRLVVGERDEKFSAIAASLARLAPGVELDRVPGAGHNVLLEAPGHVEQLLTGALAA